MKYIETSNTGLLILFTAEGNIITIRKTNRFYKLLLSKLSTTTEDELMSFLSKISEYKNIDTETVKEALDKEELFIYDDYLLIKDKPVVKDQSDNFLVQLLEVLVNTGKAINSFSHLKPFIDNILKNTFIVDKNSFLKYLLHSDYEITEDGCLLAYKKVNNNYTSFHDNSTLHLPETTVELFKYDTNPKNICSYGLHFATKDFINRSYNHYEGITLCVKVNPIDIVAIPDDFYDKCRCRKYRVVSQLLDTESLKESREKIAQEPIIEKPVHSI